ncbi:MAG: peptide-methionine (S)-S-oxide reductase MsrA [Cocleimonas sp.]
MQHFVNNHSLEAPYPQNTELAMFGMGCFWGAEKRFWELDDAVHVTAVGYAAGDTVNPSYKEVCSGMTNHNEVVLVVYHPDKISYPDLLKTFWESHNPTQGMQQGNDKGTQYRSGIYCYDESQMTLAKQSQDTFQSSLDKAGLDKITTEIIAAPIFYFAEEYHQQYLAKNPNGYCGLGGTGVCL